MDKRIWVPPFASFLIKRKLQQKYRNPRLSDHEPRTPPTIVRESTNKGESNTNPWMGVFDDPALHEALDRIMASNRIA
jgi:hypothetical protein